MKKMSFLLIVVLLPFAMLAQEESFTVTGKIGNWNAPAKIFLVYKKDGKNTADSVEVQNGTFTIKGTLRAPFHATLLLEYAGQSVWNINPRGKNDMLKLYVEKGVNRISSPDSASHAVVEGSRLNKDFQEQTALIRSVTDAGVRQQLRKSFIEKNPGAYFSMLTLWDYAGTFSNPDELEKIFLALSDSLQETKSGLDFKTMLNTVRLLKPGVAAPDFALNDPNGRTVNFASFRGKYVLIDFWASWCGPCREENPELVKLYEKFGSKNFTILGVSLDKSDQKTAWTGAIKKDKLNWQQVSDLKGWENEVAKMYGVRAIPQKFLVGPDGKIVATQFSIPELEQLLTKLLTP
jgi:peroxiredoxin